MLIDGGNGGSSSSGGGSGGGGSGGGGSGEDVGKLTRKRLNRGLPGRKQGTVRIQVRVHSQLITKKDCFPSLVNHLHTISESIKSNYDRVLRPGRIPSYHWIKVR